VSNGGKPGFCSGGRVGGNEGITAKRKSRELVQQNCRLKQTCHEKSSREKARYHVLTRK